MGFLSLLVTVSIASLIAVEGLSSGFAAERIAPATQFIKEIGTSFKFDTKAVIALLPHLKVLAISALAVIVIPFHGVLVALYLIITRATPLTKHIHTIEDKFAKSTDVLGIIGSSYVELTYILTSLALIFFFLNLTFSGIFRKRTAPKVQA